MKDDDFATSTYGVRIPKILYGTAWKKEHTAALVAQAVRLGFRGIDTACQPKHYHEAGVGEGLARCFEAGLQRRDIFLQSKFTPADGQDPYRIPYDQKASLAEQVAQSFKTSLTNLQTDYLDSLVLHSPLASEPSTMEAWRAMETIFHAGGAKQLGISNCYELDQLARLYDRSEVKPAVVQNRFYADTGYDRDIRAFCRQHGMLYQSFWTLTANPRVLAHGTVVSLAENYRRTPEQVFLRYLTQSDVIPLTGTTNELHMREDLAIFDFQLTAPERDAVAALLCPG